MRGKEEGCLSFWSRFAVPLAVEGMVGNCCGGGVAWNVYTDYIYVCTQLYVDTQGHENFQ